MSEGRGNGGADATAYGAVGRIGPGARLREGALVATLLGLALAAWLVTGAHADPHMRTGLLTGGATPGADAHAGEPMAMGAGVGAPSIVVLGTFLAMWVVMMAAMMLPSLAPVVLTFDRWARRMGRGRSGTGLFVAGYLLVWGATGLAVFGGGAMLAPLVPSGEAGVRLGAGLLVAAGAYQFTPFKTRCLQHCRSPLAFMAQHAERLGRGGLAGTRVGAIHGFYCVGCCWALMLVLILLGMMSLVWMGAVAAVIFLEKTMPRRWAVGPTVGLLLVGLGGLLLARPTLLIP